MGALEIAANNARMQTTRPLDAQRLQFLLRELRLLAEARGADVSDRAYEMYALALARFDDADIAKVVNRIAGRRRAEGEKAWPELGELVESLEYRRALRQVQERKDRERQWMINKFWNDIVPYQIAKYGVTEAELLERFPSFKGTKPR